MVLVWLVAGLVLLSAGAEILVRGASAVAVAFRVSPLIIGLTVVAYGTGTPELIVSIDSALDGQAALALGNVVGSNIFNVLFILGVSALIVPLTVSQRLIRLDVPLLIGLSLLVVVMALDGAIGRWDGILLVTGLAAYTVWAIKKGPDEGEVVEQEYAEHFHSSTAISKGKLILLNLALIAVGLMLLFLGASWFTSSSVTIARSFGMSEFVIGVTIVAVGTSLPEVATSIMAAFRGERDIAVGNVIGSNMFNIMGVLGVTSIISSEGIAVTRPTLYFDLPMMACVAIACLPIFFTGHLIARWEGALFTMYYCVYTGYLILSETNPAIERSTTVVIFGFLAPLIAISVAVPIVRSLRKNSLKQD